MTEDRNFLKKRPNWIEFVVDEISLVDVPAVSDAEVVALKRGVTNNGGDEEMDKIFIDGGHTVNRETLLLFIGEALKPIRQELADLNRRLDRLPNTTPRLPERDTFSDIVRGRTELDEVEVEKAARDEFRHRDPVGAAIYERRKPSAIYQGWRLNR